MSTEGLNVANDGSGDGIIGSTLDESAAGVHGVNNGVSHFLPPRVGVLGESSSGYGVHGSGSIGVVGDGYHAGVWGVCDSGSGVYGSGFSGVGVQGWGSTGVQGRGRGQGTGVRGDSYDGIGVLAANYSGASPALLSQGPLAGRFLGDVDVDGSLHTSRALVVGSSSRRASGATIWGSFQAYGPALLGGSITTVTGALGVNRDLYVSGNLYVYGSSKSAVVKVADGSHRALYCVESPECWFEDFGRARLVRGKAHVRLDRTFAQIVRTGDYHVFLSPEGRSRGLYVSRRTRGGFEVREQNGGTSTVPFSYRIVARRRGVDAPRFKRVKLPARPKGPAPLEPTRAMIAAPSRVRLPKIPTFPGRPDLEAFRKPTRRQTRSRGRSAGKAVHRRPAR